jgi:hypothetical protein
MVGRIEPHAPVQGIGVCEEDLRAYLPQRIGNGADLVRLDELRIPLFSEMDLDRYFSG